MSEHTVKAIEKIETASIAERKERLLRQALRIAGKAADRIEDQVDGANITQATVAFGVATEKMLLLSGDPTSRTLNFNVHADAVDLVAEFNKLHDAIRAKAKAIEAQSEETEAKTGLPSRKET